MNDHTAQSGSSPKCATIPRSHLIDLFYRSAGQLCFLPQGPTSEASKAEPIMLPAIPLSMTFWLMTLGDIHRQKSGRCLAALLLLNTNSMSWGIGLPRQQCSTDSVCWSLAFDASDPIPTGVFVAGSWQMHAQAEPDELPAVVPAMPGIHFVAHVLEEGQRHLHAFLRVGDATRSVSPADLTVDDWQFALQAAADRLIAA